MQHLMQMTGTGGMIFVLQINIQQLNIYIAAHAKSAPVVNAYLHIFNLYAPIIFTFSLLHSNVNLNDGASYYIPRQNSNHPNAIARFGTL